MKAVLKLAPLALDMAACLPAKAWNAETHRQIVLDAVQFMKTHPNQTKYAKLLAGVTKAGYTIDQFAAAIGQGAHDVDYVEDTFLCGATTGNCQSSPARGATPRSGTSRATPTAPTCMATTSAATTTTWLVNDYLDDGPGDMGGWFGDSSKYNSFGITEARYRQGSYSTRAMYGDYQNFPFQPIDNLGQYLVSRFLQAPSAQTLGFVLRATDLLHPLTPSARWRTSRRWPPATVRCAAVSPGRWCLTRLRWWCACSTGQPNGWPSDGVGELPVKLRPRLLACARAVLE